MNNNYIPIHLHTAEGSLRDSILLTEELVKKAKQLNIKSLCLTDHGSLSNMYNFYYKCIENNIKAIIGCEIYYCEDMTLKDKEHKDTYHMILLAKNNNGLKNLLKIVSYASTEGFYYKPRTDLNLIKQYKDDLICTTACVGGYIPQLILNEDEEAVKYILELKDIFNEDLYLEIQPANFEDQIKVNNKLIEYSKKYNIKLVASNDIHYLNKDDWKAHDFHVRDGRSMKAPENDNDIIYADKCYYLMTYEELYNQFINTGLEKSIIEEAINNTNNINVSCETLQFKTDKLNLPQFICPNNYSLREYIEHICFNKLTNIYFKIKNPSEYISRLYYELDVIEQLGFISYFLIIRDIIKYAEDNNIKVGPGRGSVVGSLTAYLCDITKIDPIKYNLLFERFLSIHRKGSIPDVDTDIMPEGRDLLFKYTMDKYGSDKCCAVATLGMRKSKSAIKAAGRLLGLEPSLVNNISKLIPTVYYIDLEDSGEDKKTDLSIKESLQYVEELREYQEIYPELFNIGSKIEGLPDHSGIHAAGIIIADSNIVDVAPLIKNNDLLKATSLNLHDAETQKLVKYDYLSLSNLSLIQKLEQVTGVIFDIEFNEYNDEKVWDTIGSQYTTGLFQINSNTYKKRMPRLKPKTLNELADCLALVRGPCISSKLDEKYMRILEGKEEVELIHPMYDEAVSDTYGIMIYQEQLMNCCFNMGLPLHLGYSLMKASSKKKFDKIASFKEQLHDLVKDKMLDEIFEHIFQLILDSGKYSFNRSHALAYASICYVTAFYKTYYPVEFFACLLSGTYINKSGDAKKRKEKLEEIMEDCKRLGIKFLPIDMNKSQWDFIVENNKIRIGFCALPSFSYDTYIHIKENCMPFNDLESYISQICNNTEKKICRKQSILSLIASDALGDRIEAYEEYCEIRNEKDISPILKISNSTVIEIYASQEEIEYDLFNINFVHNKINNLPKKINLQNIKEKERFNTAGYIKSIKKTKDKNNKPMAFVKIETGDGILDSVVFTTIYEKYKSVLKKDNFIKIKAEMQKNSKYSNSCKLLEATLS